MKEITGNNCITMDQGQKVYELIMPALSKQTYVELNFEGISIYASPFFNVAIGKLLKDFSSADLNTYLKFENLNPTGLEVLKISISNSQQYFKDEKHKKVIDEVIREQGDEF
ncbi:STAS-like domain-containing protein [Brevibacillus sp. IT-7CA2]|uniref:STAS-like domain-containing protein n=1 Tax=Brevibacillus sp. IT-7CA2 TaxID=3026436 RepID=UPI0039E037C0